MKKKLLSLLLICAFALSAIACNKESSLPKQDLLTRDSEGLLSGKYDIEIEIENYGNIAVTLDADLAPVTVTNFIDLVQDGFYNGLTFHRIISGFMIQGGDPKGNGTGGSGRNIQGEFAQNNIANTLNHTRGVISMARSNENNSASSQFFIMHQDAPNLDGSYAAFGNVTSGMEIVDRICKDTPVLDGNGTVSAKKQPKIKEIRIIKQYTTQHTSATVGTATIENLSLPDTGMLTVNADSLLFGKHNVEIEIENYGTIALTLDADIAPVTVSNFIDLVKDGFYNGLTFHRIMNGFMIQGGDPLGNGMGNSPRTIQGEFSLNGIENNLKHTRGVISMARTDVKDSASCQFFIMHQDAPHLDGAYAAFGIVTSGMEIVDKICKDTPSGANGAVAKNNQPKIKEIRIVK